MRMRKKIIFAVTVAALVIFAGISVNAADPMYTQDELEGKSGSFTMPVIANARSHGGASSAAISHSEARPGRGSTRGIGQPTAPNKATSSVMKEGSGTGRSESPQTGRSPYSGTGGSAGTGRASRMSVQTSGAANTAYGMDVSGNDVSGNDISGNDIQTSDVSGNEATVAASSETAGTLRSFVTTRRLQEEDDVDRHQGIPWWILLILLLLLAAFLLWFFFVRTGWLEDWWYIFSARFKKDDEAPPKDTWLDELDIDDIASADQDGSLEDECSTDDYDRAMQRLREKENAKQQSSLREVEMEEAVARNIIDMDQGLEQSMIEDDVAEDDFGDDALQTAKIAAKSRKNADENKKARAGGGGNEKKKHQD